MALFAWVALLAVQPQLGPAMPDWLAGSWATSGTADEWSEEWWTPAKAGIMLGASRSGKAEALGFFEHMRIVRDADGLAFCAMPQGKAATCFKAVDSSASHVTFENAAHDYPTRVTYRRDGAGVRAEISGPDNSKRQSWRYVRLGN
jgi:hypothetical protein